MILDSGLELMVEVVEWPGCTKCLRTGAHTKRGTERGGKQNKMPNWEGPWSMRGSLDPYKISYAQHCDYAIAARLQQ
jgi:hypothetical protein